MIYDGNLNTAEQEIHALEHEVAVLLDAEGNGLLRFGGNRSNVLVTIPDGVAEGKIFTHNHPSGRTFSNQDIANFCGGRFLEARVCTPNGVLYSLKIASDAPAWSMGESMLAEGIGSALRAAELMREQLSKGAYSYEYMMENYEKIRCDAQGMDVHNWLTENAEKFGFAYRKGVLRHEG